MNKIFHINIGGYPFTIDDIAYSHLTQYIETIRRHFSNSEGCDEIISDIETRMAELFTENMAGKSIVTIKEVQDAIKIMGTPEDFGAEAMEDESFDDTKSKRSQYKTGKRLFRNTEDQVIGGVCSGIASYFGIADPLWIRLAFVVITISGGVGVLAYILLWIILPEAKSAGDKLMMRGKPINVSNIAKTVEEELDTISEKITDLGNELKSKKKSIKGAVFIFSPVRLLAQGISLLGKGIKGVFKIIRAIVRPFIFLILGILIFTLSISWISMLIGIFSATPYAGYFISGFAPVGYIGLINLFVVVGVPLLGMILMAVRFLTSYRIDRSWLKTAWTVWGINLIMMVMIIINTVNMNSANNTWTEEIPLDLKQDQLLKIDVSEKPFDFSFAAFGSLKYHNGSMYSDEVDIDIVKSDDGEFKLIKEVRSRGKNNDVANKWAKRVIHYPIINGNTITLPAFYQLKRGAKYRFQEVQYKLMVPIDAKIELGNRTNWYLSHFEKDSEFEAPHNKSGHEWIMGENGLIAGDYVASMRYEKAVENKDFSKLNISGKIKVVIKKGDKYQTKLIGKEELVEDVEIVQQGGMLSFIAGKMDYYSSVRLQIEMPNLESLHTGKTLDVRIEGFEQDQMEIQHKGNLPFKGFINVRSLNLTIDGESEVELTGTGENLNLEIYNYGKFNGENYITSNTQLKANRYSRATIHAKDSLTYEVDREYRLKVYGDPETKRIFKEIQ